MNRAMEDTLSLLAGVGVGTALMYLLDPDQGAKRRQNLADSARDAVTEAGEYISDAGQSLADHTRMAASATQKGASKGGRRATDAINDYTQRITSAFADSGSHLPAFSTLQEHLHKRLRSSLRSAQKSVKNKTGYGSSSARDYVGPVAGYTAGGAALVALGAGIAYLFDPQRGRSRRAYLLDKSTSIMSDAGDLMRKTGKHVSNKMYGTAMEATRPIRKAAENWQQGGSSEEGSNPSASTSSQANAI